MNVKFCRELETIVYLAYCTRCGLQGVDSTIKWKARLANYKSHIKKRTKKPCRIIKHFMNTCVDPDIPHKYLRFIMIDSVNNTEDLEEEEANALLIEKRTVLDRHVTCISLWLK